MLSTLAPLANPQLLGPVARSAATFAITGLWQGLLLLSAVAVLLRALPLGSASARAAAWASAFGLAVLVPFLHLGGPAAARTSQDASLHLGMAAELPIVALWLLLSAWRAAHLLREAVHLRRLARSSQPFQAPFDLLPALAVGRRVLRLRTSSQVDSPCVLGFLRPQLLLPAHTTLSSAELHAIVLHEREHLRRHDDWVNLLQRTALVLFPLNPALALMDRRLGAERELACDAAVIARTAEPLRYAGMLTRLAEERLHLRSLALSLATWARRSELTRRVETLLRPATPVSPRRSRWAAGTVAAALFVGSAGLARAPQVVSFAAPAPIAGVSADIAPPSVTATPAQVLPAAFHPGAVNTPHAVLLRATVPASPSSARRRSRVRPAMTTLTPPAPQRLRAAALSPAPRAVLARASTTGPTAARAVLLSNDFTTYAAVPFGDGWLVLQL